jgi:hypothetical protein
VAVIDVADMEALVEIAERYDRSILHETTDDGEAFWVTDESGQFRYAVGAPAYLAQPAQGAFAEQSAPARAVQVGPQVPVVAFQTPAPDSASGDIAAPQPQVPQPDRHAHDTAELVTQEEGDWRAAYAAADVNRPRPASVLARHGV